MKEGRDEVREAPRGSEMKQSLQVLSQEVALFSKWRI